MAMEITNNYSSCAAQSVAESSTANSAKKKECLFISPKRQVIDC